MQVVRPVNAPAETEGGAVAVAAPPRSEPLVVHVTHDERREPFVEIYLGRGSERRLVTCIELLSLSNKTPGEHGRDLYLRKQGEILYGKVHLVEIDLLRGGEHTTAVPRDRWQRSPASSNITSRFTVSTIWKISSSTRSGSTNPCRRSPSRCFPAIRRCRWIFRPFSNAHTTPGRITARSITGKTRRVAARPPLAIMAAASLGVKARGSEQ